MELTPIEAIREGLQYAPVELRKLAIPALDSVVRMVEYALEDYPKRTKEEAGHLAGQTYNTGSEVD